MQCVLANPGRCCWNGRGALPAPVAAKPSKSFSPQSSEMTSARIVRRLDDMAPGFRREGMRERLPNRYVWTCALLARKAPSPRQLLVEF